MNNKERGRWGVCFGVLGTLVVAGAVVVSAPQSAEAQRRPAGPVGVAEFGRACGRCHPNGDEDTGPALRNQNKTVEEMTKIIRQGSGKMRPVGPAKLTDANLAKVMLFLRSIRAVR
jgi:mono/diheme cytochrome c family protein